MVRAAAMQCSWLNMDGNHVRLQLDASHRHLLSAAQEAELRDALGSTLGQAIRLTVERVEGAPQDATPAALADQQRAERQQQAEQAISRDPHVRALQEQFDAELIPDSIQPAD